MGLITSIVGPEDVGVEINQNLIEGDAIAPAVVTSALAGVRYLVL